MRDLQPLAMFRFLVARSGKSQRSLIVLIFFSGLSSGMLLGVANHAADMAADGTVSVLMAGLFLATLLIYVTAKRQALTHAAVTAERAIRDLRISLADKIRHSELEFLEGTGKGDIYARLSQDANMIAQCVPAIFNGYQSIVVILAALAYIAYISLTAALVTTAILGMAVWIFARRYRESLDTIAKAIAKEGEFFDSLSHLIEGFKEIKINHAKNDAVFGRLATISRQTEALMSTVATKHMHLLVLAQTFVFLILAIFVFVLPGLEYSQPETVLKLTASLLFMVAPIEIVLMAWHFQIKAQVSIASIERLERLISQSQDTEVRTEKSDPAHFADFSLLRLQQAAFSYRRSESHFHIGPLDIDIPRGSRTFIIGGNGSGKSTLLKLLTGLYPLESGAIRIDDSIIGPYSIAAYRELFTCVFSDFHLFDRLYGLERPDPEEVNRLLDWMELSDKTFYHDGRFTDLDLSTGQRKRLALIVALLEDKPIYVFDEWAADQDPEFRVRFYEEIVPDLIARGKTVIAITHDDRWFHSCDQLLKLEYGKLVSAERPARD